MRRWAGLVLGLTLSACASWPGSRPTAQIAVEATAVALNGPEQIGRARFVGALHLTTTDTDRMHGLSDLKFSEDGRFTAVNDEGWRLDARLVEDAEGRPTGLAAVSMAPLADGRGGLLKDAPRRGDGYNTWADSEGLSLTPDGVIISFEHEPRLWRYRRGGRVQALTTPPPPADINAGFEAIADDGRGGLWVAAEAGGVWRCAAVCVEIDAPPVPPIMDDTQLRVVGLDRDPFGRGLWVLRRAYARGIGNTIRVGFRPFAGEGLGPEETVFELAAPMTRDNFEGVAAVRRGDGVRLYLISDDNFSDRQRTLLMTFDMAP